MTTLNHVEPSIAAAELFAEYISKRRPVIIRGFPEDSSFQAQKWTDFDYLASKAGDTEVLVEPMHPLTLQFGTDIKRIAMQFRDFLDTLKSDEGPHHYLTTQYSGEEWNALTVFSPPTNALLDDFPIVPHLMGNLFLQQANLWLGKSENGSTSGLHHDFHDNFYCLLKGRKRFVLFPPHEHQNLYPHGELREFHKNGVISYDQILRADGLDRRVALQARVAALERRLDTRSINGKGKGKLDTNERKALQCAYEEAYNELCSFAEDESHGFPLDHPDEESTDESSEEDDGDDFGSLAGDLEDGHDDYDALMLGLDGDDKAVPSRTVVGDSNAGLNGGSPKEDVLTVVEKGDGPPSFSRIPVAYLHEHLNLPTTAVPPPNSSPDGFPNLARATAPYVVELLAGEMLYLPASWWHEVTSSSGTESVGERVHMAFNYWFYPPDSDNFEEPYKDKLVWNYLREKAGKDRDNGEGKGGKMNVDVTPEAKRKWEDEGAQSTKKARK